MRNFVGPKPSVRHVGRVGGTRGRVLAGVLVRASRLFCFLCCAQDDAGIDQDDTWDEC